MATAPARAITIYSPLARADLPGLYTRVCRTLGENAGLPVVCDVTGMAADAVVVDALCRLQLGAKHWGCAVRLRNASRELLELVTLCGLDDVIRAEEVATPAR
jgi:ABC-type transporter Mla MlaB component